MVAGGITYPIREAKQMTAIIGYQFAKRNK
jgi:hypothetical protein